MKRLIVTADDLGVHPSRNHGIFMAFEQGIVRNALLDPTGPDSARAAKHAAEKKLPTGIQFTLTDHASLSAVADIETLVERQGCLYTPKTFLRLLKEGKIDRTHIERELRAQVEWFWEHHGPPTHFGSTGNVHVLPELCDLFADIASSSGLRFVRMPAEPLPPHGFEIERDQLQQLQELTDHAEKAKAVYHGAGIEWTLTRGLALEGNASQKNLRHILGKLPDTVTELITHPGSPTPTGTSADTHPQRQTELLMLTEPSLPTFLSERKIVLCSFSEL